MRGRYWLVAAAVSLAAAMVAPVLAQSISYTVQVVALSDREAALNLQSDLIRQGFPAYVVRSTSAQGDVFRVRVGAFANRAAALTYASGMSVTGGGQPVPALAEAIPPGITPLAPLLLVELPLDGRDVAVGTLGEALVLRSQARVPLGPAEYVIVEAGSVQTASAWRLGERDGRRLWVRETLLWPPTWRDESDAVREGFRTSLIRLLAERLEVEPEAVAAAQYRPDPEGAPRLVVVELEAPDQPDGVVLLAIGLPFTGMTHAGPLEYLGVELEDLPPVASDVDLAGLLDEPPTTVTGESWSAVADGEYIRLDAFGSSWRAGLGTPLWSDGRYLLAALDGRLLVYDFVQR